MSFGETGIAVSAEHIAVQSVLIALAIGVGIAVLYFLVFRVRRKMAPATGSVGYLIFETVAICGIFQILLRMARLEYVGKLNPEEHLYIGLGTVIAMFILGKRVVAMFTEAYSQSKTHGNEGRTEEDGG